MFEITMISRPPADRAGTGGVPHLGQVPQLGPGVMTPGREPEPDVDSGESAEPVRTRL